MKTIILVCIFLIIPLVGTVRRPVPPPRAKSLALSSSGIARQNLLKRLELPKKLFQAGDFHQAASLFQEGYQDALGAGERKIAALFLGNFGGCRFALHQYREALRALVDARGLAEAAGDGQTAGALDFNISSLYFQLGQLDAAVDAANRAMARLSGEDRAKQLPKLLIHLATLRAQQDRMPEALALFQQGIAAADRANDPEMYALGWNDLGEVYLDRKQLPQAERALLEAYRVRKLNRLRSLESSYRNLGRLRLDQGDLDSASMLLDDAVERSRQPGGLLPSWEVYEARGQARLAQNRLREALDDLRIAARLARIWRRAAPLDDATRVSAENAIQSVHSALVEAGNKLYFAAGGRSLAQETFEAAEANRAASMRTLLSEPRDWRGSLPPEYWETLSKLESAEVELLRGHGGADRLQQLQGALIQWESRAGSNAGSSGEMEIPDLLDRVQRSLGPDAALLTFHLASPDSYLWAVTRAHFALYRLPPAAEIAPLADQFQKAVRAGSPEATPAGYRLYRALFGPLPRAIQRKTHWLLALDAQLFELPFAALVVETAADGPVFLAERHSVETTAGAGMLALSAATPRPSSLGPFLGIADPVYNTADPRWHAARQTVRRRCCHLLRAGRRSASRAPGWKRSRGGRLRVGLERPAAAGPARRRGSFPPRHPVRAGLPSRRLALRHPRSRIPPALPLRTHRAEPRRPRPNRSPYFRRDRHLASGWRAGRAQRLQLRFRRSPPGHRIDGTDARLAGRRRQRRSRQPLAPTR